MVLLVVAASFGCARSEPPEPTRIVTRVEESDPPPHFHPHPDVPPDELGDDTDAGLATAPEPPPTCPEKKTPPPPVKAKLRIASGPPVTNYIPPEIIMRPVRKRIGCMRQCFEAGLAKQPTLGGRIAFQFVVEGDGWVRNVKVRESELGAPDVEECMRTELVGLEYPAPAGGQRITVVYPMVFAPKK
jgi:hypothetical protein